MLPTRAQQIIARDQSSANALNPKRVELRLKRGKGGAFAPFHGCTAS